MGGFIWLLIIATSIWVVVDAKSIGVKSGQIKGLGNMGPWGWFFVCLLFWIVGFPFYLAKRGEFKRVNSELAPVNSSNVGLSDSITQIERLAALKEKGIISDEEFVAKKRQLLG